MSRRFGTRRIAAVTMCGALALFASACGGDDDDDDDTGSGSGTVATTTVAADDGESNVTAEDLEAYVGLTVADAEAMAEEAGLTSRVVSIDGEDLAVTLDFNPNRVNFVVVDDMVTEATTG